MLHKLVSIVPQFPNHEIYLWSNYGFNETKDIDLKFVGDVTPLISQQRVDFPFNYKTFLDILDKNF